MARQKPDIYVFAHWKELAKPELMGTMSAHYGKGRKAFSFEYDNSWIKSQQQRLIDPDIQFCSGAQLPNQKENFRIFLDSMPDTWGRTLMKRRAVQQSLEQGDRTATLYDIDYLLGVYDDNTDKAAWEYLAYELGIAAGHLAKYDK